MERIYLAILGMGGRASVGLISVVATRIIPGESTGLPNKPTVAGFYSPSSRDYGSPYPLSCMVKEPAG